MAIDTYAEWVADGRRHEDALALAQFAAVLRGYGYTVWTLGNDAHAKRGTPPGSRAEDHMPYSSTPWPGRQPYPYVLACDIPDDIPKGCPSLAQLADQIHRDKQASIAGTEWIKYMNWEPSGPGGPCLHCSWQPGHVQRSSSDRGHIHISGRTDYATTAGPRYDPVARWRARTGKDDDMGFLDEKNTQTGRTGGQMLTDLWWAKFKGNASDIEQAALKRVEATLAAIAADPGNDVVLGTEQVTQLAGLLAPLLPTADQVAAAVAAREAAADRARADALTAEPS